MKISSSTFSILKILLKQQISGLKKSTLNLGPKNLFKSIVILTDSAVKLLKIANLSKIQKHTAPGIRQNTNFTIH